jgi:hypothetical protein
MAAPVPEYHLVYGWNDKVQVQQGPSTGLPLYIQVRQLVAAALGSWRCRGTTPVVLGPYRPTAVPLAPHLHWTDASSLLHALHVTPCHVLVCLPGASLPRSSAGWSPEAAPGAIPGLGAGAGAARGGGHR